MFCRKTKLKLILAILFCLMVQTVFAETRLDVQQSRFFRQWFLFIINEQTYKKPNPRWIQRDCAGLIRFAVGETFTEHHDKWVRANGLDHHSLPPNININHQLKKELSQWFVPGKKKKSNFVMAHGLIQENTEFVTMDINQARPGDLLFFDQGDDQHLMVWTGRTLAYHTGALSDKEKTIKVVHPKELLKWKDTRWRPVRENPNYLGVYRFSFLSY